MKSVEDFGSPNRQMSQGRVHSQGSSNEIPVLTTKTKVKEINSNETRTEILNRIRQQRPIQGKTA